MLGKRTLILDYSTITFKILILANPFENTAASFRVNFVFLDGSTAIFFSWSFYEESAEQKMNT